MGRILLPKFRGFADPQQPIIAGKTGFSGEARCILYDENLNEKMDTGWFPNLIVDNGLDLIRTQTKALTTEISIGEGTAPAEEDDIALELWLYSSDVNNDGAGAGNAVKVKAGAPNYEYSEVVSRRFDATHGTGTVTEISIGLNSDGTNIFNRVLLDTPIVKADNHVLDVLFRVTCWPPAISDILGTATIAGVSYNTITRGIGHPVGTFNDNLYSKFKGLSSDSNYFAFSGDLGELTDSVAQGNGDALGFGSDWGLSYSTYFIGDYFVDFTVFCPLDGWVVTDNLIRTLTYDTNMWRAQTQFNAVSGGAAIPKDSTEIMDFTWRFSWARK
jgi:hypothetical protein